MNHHEILKQYIFIKWSRKRYEHGGIEYIAVNWKKSSKEIKWRIALGWQTFGRVSTTFENTKKKGRRVYNQWILPTVTHGAETWNLTKKNDREAKNHTTCRGRNHTQSSQKGYLEECLSLDQPLFALNHTHFVSH